MPRNVRRASPLAGNAGAARPDGFTQAEQDRRLAAARAAHHGIVPFSSLAAALNREAEPNQVREPADGLSPAGIAKGEAVPEVTDPAASPPVQVHRAFEPDHPIVTITISGNPGSGKSVIAHVIRHALAREGIVTSGPDGLRSLPWHRALDHLSNRGLTVVLCREGGAS